MKSFATGIEPAIVIAAGGLGERMGGRKPERLLDGAALIDHAILWARKQRKPLAVAVRKDQQLPADIVQMGGSAMPVLTDNFSDAGPIAALQSAFRFAGEIGCKHVLMIGCDMPFLPDDLISRLSAAIGHAGAALPLTADRPQTMAGLWKVDGEALEHYLNSGQKSLWSFAELQHAVRVDWPCERGHDPFVDIDDEAALGAAERMLAAQRPAS